MKNKILLWGLLFVGIHSLRAQTSYQDIMKQNVAALDTMTTTSNFQSLANTFERIASVEQKQWLPYYYAGYCYIELARGSKDNKQKDSFLDHAKELCDQADKLKPNDSEIYALLGYLYGTKIGIDPATRGMIYGPLSGKTLNQAVQFNPENPRAYFIQAISTFFRPEAFGGGKEKAKPLFEKALEKYKTFQPQSPIDPHWGNVAMVEAWLKKCQ